MRAYASPQAFKQALEQRLKSASNSGVDFARRRQLLVFDRFLARVVAVFGDTALLKGGLVLELRLERARATKDVDLRLMGSPESVLANLREAGRLDLMDFMTYEIAPETEHPQIQNEGMRYEGLRFRAESRLAGKLYGQPFGVDVAFGDPILGEPETVTAEDILAFAGVAPPTLRLYPIETHIAEKLHAYTLPRLRPNTRVKDLPDIALLGTTQPLDAARLRMALAQTFEFRGTHAVPSSVPDPPPSWSTPYRELASENELGWTTLEELTVAVGAFLNPVLAGQNGTWRPTEWQWS
ncbi:MAG TPA: nucleotidyl transferase AbiEii/AbiGii toxin family protein [Steroidobacteraceae bacterium]|nr:nucleotidyl transferase AbiEii/AbiGii toxin family protein [Steroidobacteraceae bacterium]